MPKPMTVITLAQWVLFSNAGFTPVDVNHHCIFDFSIISRSHFHDDVRIPILSLSAENHLQRILTFTFVKDNEMHARARAPLLYYSIFSMESFPTLLL